MSTFDMQRQLAAHQSHLNHTPFIHSFVRWAVGPLVRLAIVGSSGERGFVGRPMIACAAGVNSSVMVIIVATLVYFYQFLRAKSINKTKSATTTYEHEQLPLRDQKCRELFRWQSYLVCKLGHKPGNEASLLLYVITV